MTGSAKGIGREPILATARRGVKTAVHFPTSEAEAELVAGGARQEQYRTLSAEEEIPLLIGEWEFGVREYGTPSPELCPVDTERDRAVAFSHYLEGAAAEPWYVGSHQYPCYGQSPTGGVHGENFSIELFDVCDQPAPETIDAAQKSHERLYAVTRGDLAPFEAAE